MKQTLYRLLAVVLCVCAVGFSAIAQPVAAQFDSKIVRDWNALFLDIERSANGFRPCPAATAAGYMGFSLYESVVPSMAGFQSQARLFSGLNLPAPPVGAVHWPAAANESYAYLMAHFFSYLSTTQPTNFAKIEALRLQNHNQFVSVGINSAALAAGESRGQAVAQAVWTWFEADPTTKNAWLAAQPASYVPPVGPGLWQPTAPDFSKAVFPFYGSARCFAMPEAEKTALPPPVFSETAGSVWYQQAQEVFNDVNTIRANGPGAYDLDWVAKFWSDDLLNLTFSPPSRLLGTANQLDKIENLNLAEAAELYAKLGLAMHDIAVATWKSKYIYNIERPVSYIRRVFPGNSTWVSALDHPLTGAVGVTPAFPGYPSGHSGFGGVMDGIFSDFFGKTYTFTDSIHAARTEFNGKPRTFTSFAQMGEENAYSRIALGVHFRFDCDEGLRLGRLAARRVLEMPWLAPDCNLVTVVPSAGQIEVRGLTSPIVLVQIFNAAWQKVHDFSGSLGATSIRTISGLAAGNYFVKINLLNASWQPICEKTGFFNVSGGSPTGVLTVAQPADISTTAAVGQTGAAVSFSTPTASSTCPTGSVAVVQTSGAASGSVFPIGQTTVCFKATDGCGNQETRCFKITVNAAQPPTDCSALVITPSAGQILVEGLSSPIVIVQAFNSTWQQVYNFSGASGSSRLISGLTAGVFFVKIDLLTASWQPICHLEKYVTVGGGTQNLPDLTLANLNLTTTTAAQGTVANFKFDLKNIGTAAATGNFSIKSYLSLDAILDANDVQNGAVQTGNIAAGQTVAQVAGALGVPSNLPAGQYFILLKADADDLILESNEANNTLVSTTKLTVTTSGSGSGPDLELSISADKTTVNQWATATFTLTAKNNGSANLTAATIKIGGCAAGVFKFFDQNFGLVYTGVPAAPTKGAFNFVTQEWSLANLAAGQSATLTIQLFALTAAEKRVVAWTTAQNPSETDSQPSADFPTTCTPAQDDEAAWTINAGQSVTNEVRSSWATQNLDDAAAVFPNPAGETAFVNLTDFVGKEDLTIQLFDAKGLIFKDLRLEKVVLPTEQLDLSDLQNGLYWLRIVAPNERAKTMKLAVQRTF